MILHNDRCIHCAQCVDSCPTKAYHMNGEFELAVLDRHQLKIEYK
ncbi:MAG: 4Fe-4S binding protein [Candidatus Aminicenantes bacterium]|nr:4Fe-4S binding protein [Candidatus Aminicenantes bacterium]